MEAELHGARYFKRKNNRIFMFQNSQKKYLDVDNDIIYICLKISIQNSLYFGLDKNNKCLICEQYPF